MQPSAREIVTRLGFKRCYAIVFALGALQLGFLADLVWTYFPNSEIALDLWFWWHETPQSAKVLNLVVVLVAYAVLVFYAALTVFDHLREGDSDDGVKPK